MSYPIILITGYLGSGKTTLLNHILGLPGIQEQKIALIINEFGSIGMDGKLVRPGDYARYEINKGSLFCICTKTDFIKTLEDLDANVKPDLIIVETSGVAETRDIISFIDEPHLKGKFEIKADLCIIDAANFTKVAPMLKAARSQVEWADGIIVNKMDMVTERELEKLGGVVSALNPDAPTVSVSFGEIPEAFINVLGHTKRSGGPVEGPPEAIFQLSFRIDQKVDRKAFEEMINRFRENILRLKGYIDFGDAPTFIEFMNEELSDKPELTSEESESTFTVIAWNMDKEELRAAFENCWS